MLVGQKEIGENERAEETKTQFNPVKLVTAEDMVPWVAHTIIWMQCNAVIVIDDD